MIYFNEFLLLAIIHFLAVVAPGPDFAVVVQQSISYGRKIGAITALGIGAGISVHVIYTILGFGLLIQTNAIVFNTVKIISALYLIYLGINLIKGNLKKEKSNVNDPKATIFFLGIFTTVVNQNTPMQVQFLYGIWMCMVNAGWFILVAYLFTTKNIRNVFLKKKGLFEIFMGIVLIGLALRLLLTFN